MPFHPLQAGRECEAPFPRLLREWRQRRRVSQLALALDSGVSQRHLSFLESGRSRPSREMVLQLAQALEIPLRERNALLDAAGFSAAFRTSALEDPGMGMVMTAVRRMLQSHHPYPALALDRAWNIRLTNGPFDRLEQALGPELWTRLGGAPRNLLRLFFHPLGLRPQVLNWTEVAPLLWHRASREAEAVGGEDMRAILAELAPHQEESLRGAALGARLLPVLPLDLEVGGLQASFFTVISTFGTALDVTTDELRIESMFPANAPTESFFRTLGGAGT